MYKLLLFIKYILHCKLQIKIKTRIPSNNELKRFKIFEFIQTINNKVMIGYSIKAKWIGMEYKNTIIILGLKGEKTIYECNFKEFQELYKEWFYPHLISSDTIIVNQCIETLSKG